MFLCDNKNIKTDKTKEIMLAIFRFFKKLWHNESQETDDVKREMIDITDVMERVYPGYKQYVLNLPQAHVMDAGKSVKEFIERNGGNKRFEEYYNNAEDEEKSEIRTAFANAFLRGDSFEEKILYINELSSKVKDKITQHMLANIKDQLVISSIKTRQRTLDDWITFQDHEQDLGRPFTLSILEKIDEDGNLIGEAMHDEQQTQDNQKAQDNAPSTPDLFEEELLEGIYDEYNGIVFRKLSSYNEFRNIVVRGPHSEKLVHCQGKKILLYLILYRLYLLLPDGTNEKWLDDILSECGIDKDTISKKYTGASSSTNDETRNVAESINRLFDRQEIKR